MEKHFPLVPLPCTPIGSMRFGSGSPFEIIGRTQIERYLAALKE
jgi:hypothetical protein